MDDNVDEAKKYYEEKIRKLEDFKTAKKRFLEEEKNLNARIRFLGKLPYPQQLLSIPAALIFLIVFAKYLPLIHDWVMVEYAVQAAMKRNLFLASLVLNIVFMGLMFVTYFFAGSVIKVWLRAGILRKPVLAWLTKNRTVEFKTPKKLSHDVWDVDDDSAVMVDSDAVFTAPHKVPIMLGTPEFPVGVNLRGLLRGQPVNFDTTAVKMYAKAHENRAMRDMRTGMDAIRPFVMPLIILFTIGLIMFPVVDKKLDQTNEIKSCQDEMVSYRMKLADNGIDPNTGRPVSSQPPSVEKTGNSEKPGPSSTGIKIR